MKNTRHSSTKRNGFTLIELLVVISIIAIIAAILFPVFARARENARRASCQNNLKQIALGFAQYKQDYDGRYPHAWDIAPADFGNKPWDGGNTGTPTLITSPPNNDPVVWPAKLMPYLKSRQIFTCPSVKAPVSSSCNKFYYHDMIAEWGPNQAVVHANGQNSNYYIGASLIGYGYNAYYLGGGQYPGGSCRHVGSPSPSAGHFYNNGIGALDAEIASSATTILLLDNYWGNRGAGAAPAFADRNSMSNAAGDVDMWCNDYDHDSLPLRHLEGLNVAFADGHVKWMKKSAVLKRPAGLSLSNQCYAPNTHRHTDPDYLWNRL